MIYRKSIGLSIDDLDIDVLIPSIRMTAWFFARNARARELRYLAERAESILRKKSDICNYMVKNILLKSIHAKTFVLISRIAIVLSEYFVSN